MRNEAENLPFFESGSFCPYEELPKFIILPEDRQKIPKVLVYISPARSGSTAIGVLMACNPKIDRSYFQPFKNALRHRRETMIYPDDQLIMIKDTLGPMHKEELFDPVEILLNAGVPLEKITLITGLRNPVSTMRSLEHFVPGGMNVEYYAQMQAYLINLYEKCKGLLNVVPFSYDLFEMGEIPVLNALFRRIEVNYIFSDISQLKFNKIAVD